MMTRPGFPEEFITQVQLSLAAAGGDLSEAQLKIDKGANPGTVNKDGISPLGLAIKGGHLEMVRLLMAAMGNLSQCEDALGFVSLAATAPQHGKEVFALLAQAGTNLGGWRDHDGGVLSLAVLHQPPETIEWLIEQGAMVDTLSSDDNTPLISVIKRNTDPDMIAPIVSVLLRHGANPAHRNRAGEGAMIQAVRRARLEVIELLTEHGEDLLQRTRFGGNLAHYLCGVSEWGSPEVRVADMQARSQILVRLLDAGLDVNDCENSYQTCALHHAATAGSLPLLEILLGRGARIDCQDETGGTALHWAVHGKSPESARWLLEHGADPAVRDYDGKTADEAADSDEARALYRGLLHEVQLDHGVTRGPKHKKGRL